MFRNETFILHQSRLFNTERITRIVVTNLAIRLIFRAAFPWSLGLSKPGCPILGRATKIEIHDLCPPNPADKHRRKTRVLRFGPNLDEAATGRRNRNGSASRQRWRLWMLLVALGLVLVTMRKLNSPNTARRLGQIFGAPEVATQQQQPVPPFVLGSDVLGGGGGALGGGKNFEPPIVATKKHAVGENVSDALALVKDNTYFRPAESAAWFGLFARLQNRNARQLREEGLGEVTYVQLLEQPEVYRGRVVTVRGTLRREEVERPAKNSLGIETYHRLVIQPRGGGHWPFVVYCLELPSSFPRGDDLQAPIAVTGFFFKNWSYAWQDGLGIAPVVLASNVDWQPAVAAPIRRAPSGQKLTAAIVAACLFAALTVSLVLRNTRRPRRPSPSTESISFPKESNVESNVESIQDRLERLAKTEPQE